MTCYVMTFFKNALDSTGHRFKAPQENIEIRAATPEQAIAAAELRFASMRHVPNWRYHADTVEISTGSTPVQRCTMRSDTILSLEQHIRDELLLQRRLGSSRRTASAHMPPLQRTGLPLKPKGDAARVTSQQAGALEVASALQVTQSEGQDCVTDFGEHGAGADRWLERLIYTSKSRRQLWLNVWSMSSSR